MRCRYGIVGLSIPHVCAGEAIRDWVQRETGIVLGPDPEVFEGRLFRIQERYGCDGLEDLMAALDCAESKPLREEIIDAATTQETSWFRDVATFDALRAIVRSRNGNPISVWSAGCAYGQEIYSVAMVLAETQSLANARLLATDISPSAVRRAAEGRYMALEMARGLSEIRRRAYFHPDGIHWALNAKIRDAVEFRCHDLRESIGERFDLVFCRNVLFYFDAPAQRLALDQLAQAIKPDGYLALGNAESLRRLDAPFRKFSIGGAAFYAPLPSMYE